MAMNFGPRPQAQAQAAASMETVQNDVMDIKPFDVQADREEARNALAHSPEVEAMTAQIDVNDLTTIVSFGKDSAEKISQASDVVLRSMSLSQVNDTGKLLSTLGKVMDQFNIEEIR